MINYAKCNKLKKYSIADDRQKCKIIERYFLKNALNVFISIREH